MSLQPISMRRELQNLLESDPDFKERSLEGVTMIFKPPSGQGVSATKSPTRLIKQSPMIKQINPYKSPIGTFRKLNPTKEHSKIINQLPVSKDTPIKHSQQYRSRERVQDGSRESLMIGNRSAKVRKTSTLSYQSENKIDNKLIILPKRPQNNTSLRLSSRPSSGNAKVSQIKEIFEAYKLKSRPQSGQARLKQNSQSIQNREHLLGRGSSNLTPRLEINNKSNADNLNPNLSNLIKKKNYRYSEVNTSQNRNKLPENSLTKESPTWISYNKFGRNSPSMQLNRSLVADNFPKRGTVHQENPRSRTALRSRTPVREFNPPIRTESSQNSRVSSFLTEPETTRRHLNSKSDYDKVRSSFPLSNSNEYDPRDGLIRRPNKAGRAQSQPRNRSTLSQSQPHEAIYTGAKKGEGLMQNTNSSKRFEALMNELDISDQFRDVHRFLRKSRKSSLMKKVSWHEPE